MKNITLIFAILLSLTASAQDGKYYASAGATLSGSTISDNLGLYATIGKTNMLTQRAGYLGEIQFVKESSATYQASSFTGTFAYRIFPITKLSIDLGFQIGINVSDSWSGEGDKPGNGRMDGVAGIQFQVSEKIGIVSRYNYHIADLPFKGYAQLGITYGF